MRRTSAFRRKDSSGWRKGGFRIPSQSGVGSGGPFEYGRTLLATDPLNQGLQSIGSATNFQHYVETTYIPITLPLMAKSTQERYYGIIRNYLIPAFGGKCLRELTPMTLQAYFTGLVSSPLSHESKDKIKDVLSGILQTAITNDLLLRNPMENVRMPPREAWKKTEQTLRHPRTVRCSC